ncbi:FAD-dependent oxidoreductase [Xinfangfangia sp. CPCC 101601]|uniref:FAD-dependent oxidoreductase n=1 Tax=Pseudogemmobacter lacusdianii TaxID=3069608 RepID=A0ABU0VWI0_9RHOB|nr:FAD-dependent oxidoreductase [Xinfangfangia sp. CPCC 101601]MDQ2066112.1 FAD-dependent oxidoreductase [Xinfangfangia sp. CPCC 101601]
MPPIPSCEIAIIGAGVIGMTIADRLSAEGRDVVLIDPEAPGMGCSYGNAGTIADYAVEPVGTPEVLKSLPSLLFNRNSPLAIRPQSLTALAPWLMRFARQSLPKAAAQNAHALASLLQDAGPMWRDLAQSIGAEAILQERGCLYLYQTPQAYQAAESAMARRRALGVEVDILNTVELAAIEPALPPLPGAALFPHAVFMDDPGEMMTQLAAHLQRRAAFCEARIDRITRQVNSILLEGPGFKLYSRKVILAAGAHSRALAAMAGDKIPLETERGYHVEWDMPAPLLNRPACPTARGFYLCPMHGRLRVAGTVELGGLTAPPSPHRIAKLIEGALEIFPDLPPEPDRAWMGFRPSLPDSLPVIGASRQGPEVIHAYGHGHLGMTLAPLTARIVCDLVAGRAPHIDLAPVSPTRF